MIVTRTHYGFYQAVIRLSSNALRFRYHRFRNSPLKPAALSLAVINRCNSHCVMCNIWKAARDTPDIKSRELSCRQIISFLSDPLFSKLAELDITGGEPHLRDDLVDIITGIARLKKGYLSGLKSIIVTSNGFLTDRVITNYRLMLEALRDTGIDLVAVTSLDGIGEVHNTVRGTRGAFRLVSETIRGILELKKEFPLLIPGIKTTVLPHNIDSLSPVLDLAMLGKLFHIISPVLFTESRFKNSDKRGELSMKTADLIKLRDFYSHDELKAGYFYSTARDFLTDGRKRWTCAAMYNYAFIDFDGSVYPCEMLPVPIGNIKEQSFAEIWDGPGARDRRKKIGRLEYCRNCHEPGAVRYSAVTEGYAYLKFLLKLGRRKYHESLAGEGYLKYLPGKEKVSIIDKETSL